MITMLRRMFWTALLAGAGYAGWTTWQSRSGDAADAAPEWPPLDPPDQQPATDAVAAAVPSAGPPPAATAPGFAELPTDDAPSPRTSATAGSPAPSSSSTSAPSSTAASSSPSSTSSSTSTWVEPVAGGCPDGYPIKANDNSGIFHVPGGRFYDRTVPERCYADAHDAEADGYRRAKA